MTNKSRKINMIKHKIGDGILMWKNQMKKLQATTSKMNPLIGREYNEQSEPN